MADRGANGITRANAEPSRHAASPGYTIPIIAADAERMVVSFALAQIDKAIRLRRRRTPTPTTAPATSRPRGRSPRVQLPHDDATTPTQLGSPVMIGTRMVSNAKVSKMKAKPTRTSRKIGSALDRFDDTSMLDAVVGPTRMCAPVCPQSMLAGCTACPRGGRWLRRSQRRDDPRSRGLSGQQTSQGWAAVIDVVGIDQSPSMLASFAAGRPRARRCPKLRLGNNCLLPSRGNPRKRIAPVAACSALLSRPCTSGDWAVPCCYQRWSRIDRQTVHSGQAGCAHRVGECCLCLFWIEAPSIRRSPR
jgi:hypothetical protein